MARILITGGSGLIGTALTKALRAEGHEVRHLGRKPATSPNVQTFIWDPSRGTIDPHALDGVDHIVHLSGAPVVGPRWTTARLKELEDSRAGAALLLRRTVRERVIALKSFISASGIGWYGAITDDREHTEDEPAASDAIGQLTRHWEEAADTFNDLCRVVKLRTPIVLAREGGALPRLVAPIRWSVAVPLGTGRQWMPWVHIDDLVRIYQHAISDEGLRGSYNVNAPEQPDNRSFMRSVSTVLHRPFLPIGVPAFALHLALGDAAGLLLEGCRASNRKLLSTGFRFQYEQLAAALNACLL